MILPSSLISVQLWQVRCCFLSYELFIRSSSALCNSVIQLEQFCLSPLVPSLLSHVSIVLWFWPSLSQNRFQLRRHGWRITFSLDTGGLPGNGGQESVNGDSPPGLGGTRLVRIASAVGRQLLEKLNSARKNFPMEIFLLLLGFYMANALARILGQTGDWYALVAGVVVAAIRVTGQPVRA